ncbi:histidinol-phosphate aminotransferase [Nitrosopumilus zosterae]|uniref:Histidinol-phosphate aminotransferase n=1 Tax=Nitrosopumilus zosterae TaxID=718286 RepID=A0A2S2KSU9_9ARCH|nr:histidinol-phosphate transaminase [Nitrosopumilus zosterae]BDQ30137.1 histidinol-phosphate transaminase [Nitrosopumilus zosterae]GBH34760.1 histidinol-phosphate aminotransferase [Nitrosopumilus zosterae]
MKKNWFDEKIKKFSLIGGYKKPELLKDAVKLDSNENYVISKQFQNDILLSAKKSSDVREYPLGGAERLIDMISKFIKVSSSMIGVGNGSDQILDLILSNFASKETKVLTSNPTFGFFEERCKLYSIPLIAIPFSNSMKLDVKDFMKQSKDASILYLDSPNNPTGFQFSKNDLTKLVKSFEGLVIIDEAYGEFGDYSLANMVKTQENLIVVQTLSKSFGLAGLRLGYFIANKKFTDTFMTVLQYPYPLSTITIESGISALEKSDLMKDAVNNIKTERKRVIETLQKYDSFEVFDSKANFVLFDAHGSYKRVFAALAEQGISIRKLGKIGSHEGCLRVTIGTKEMNSKFLLAIRDLLG